MVLEGPTSAAEFLWVAGEMRMESPACQPAATGSMAKVMRVAVPSGSEFTAVVNGTFTAPCMEKFPPLAITIPYWPAEVPDDNWSTARTSLWIGVPLVPMSKIPLGFTCKFPPDIVHVLFCVGLNLKVPLLIFAVLFVTNEPTNVTVPAVLFTFIK
ncbi:MAG: hypothetical protein KCHDKBKB_02010 [Elusimicrobia bacterium]|nr:hypothetical protein [Elusimicrobiota bacterium]